MAVLPAVLVLAACGGPDLAKENFPRTTVTAPAAPAGTVTDPAVSLPALRTVDPCGLLDGATVGDLGGVKPGSLDNSTLGECQADLTDTGGKQLTLHVKLDEITIKTDGGSGTVEGLPLAMEGPDENGCTATAITSKNPGYGISMNARYPGGDPCGAAQTALGDILRRLHDNPARLPTVPGSLLDVDFCSLLDEPTITSTLGRGSAPQPYGLHGCSWSGGTASGYLDYDLRPAPGPDDGQPVDLGNGVTGFQKLDTTAGRECDIDWQHRPAGQGEGEVVSFKYDNFHDDAGNDDACGKAQTAAKALIPKLPHA